MSAQEKPESVLSRPLDRLPTFVLLQTFHRESLVVYPATSALLPKLAELVDQSAERLRAGGRLFYVGAGSSGRQGILDAADCPGMFGVDPECIQGLLAGSSKEDPWGVASDWEDDVARGRADLAAFHPTQSDVVLGLSASGRTPYVGGALQVARESGCLTALLTSHPNADLAEPLDLCLVAETGPEVIEGASRLNAGTAQKLVLNWLSTGIMVRLGHVYKNWMVGLRATNQKLLNRASHLVSKICDVSLEKARASLVECNWSVKCSVVSLALGLSPSESQSRLDRAQGHLRKALGTEPKLDARAGPMGVRPGAQ